MRRKKQRRSRCEGEEGEEIYDFVNATFEILVLMWMPGKYNGVNLRREPWTEIQIHQTSAKEINEAGAESW